MRRILLSLLLAALAAPALAGPRLWTIDDILAARTVSDPQVSPDGRWIAYVVSELNEDKSEYQTDVWLVPAGGGESRRLTTSQQADESPRWSPDGALLAFVSERPRPGGSKDDTGSKEADEGKRQIWLIHPDGGEAWVLSASKGGVSSFEWSRDGGKMAYLAREPKTEERKKKEKDKDDAWTPAMKYAWNRLWVMDVESKKGTQITRGEFHVTGFSFSPDGRQLAIAGQPTPLIPDNYNSDLYLVGAAGGKPTPLVHRRGIDNNPAWSPDGKWIAFVSQDEATAWYSNTYSCVVAPTGGRPRNLTAGFDERVSNLDWGPQSDHVTFQATQRMATQLFRAHLDGRVEPITQGPEMNGALSCDAHGSVSAFVRQDSEHPGEVYRLRSPGGSPERLTDTNPWVRELASFKKQRYAWKGADGWDMEGLVIYPAGYRSGQKVPLLVNVHGGPAGTQSNTWSATSRIYPFPIFAQKGYAIFFPNPRGSGGYGGAFRAANVRDWGGRDYEDILRGVDALVADGVADPGRLAICGWSYGGFMTSTVVTKTDRFRAAAVGAGVTDLFSMALTCDIPEFNRSYFESWPWEDPTFYAEHSAVVHAGKVRTPTLIVHGEKDDRVPVSQGWEFYTALKKVGVPTDLLLLPRAPHGPREPKLLRTVQEWHLDWINRHTLPAAPVARGPAREARSGEKLAGSEPR